MGLSAFMLAITGALSPASAATYWWYSNTNGCLGSSGGNALVLPCTSQTTQDWYWGTESNQWQGHTMRRLVNRYTGACLTTDNATELNAVWMSPCGGGRSGQFWTADNNHIQNQNGNFLISDQDGTLNTVREGADAPVFLWYGHLV